VSSEHAGVKNKGLIGLILVVGLFCGVRLGGQLLSARTPPQVEPAEEMRDRYRRTRDQEKQLAEEMWKKSRRPLPPGGFDIIWQKMTKGEDLDEVRFGHEIVSEQQGSQEK